MSNVRSMNAYLLKEAAEAKRHGDTDRYLQLSRAVYSQPKVAWVGLSVGPR